MTEAGIDVGKMALDLAVEGQPRLARFANMCHGIAKLVERLQFLGAPPVVLEAAGGYEEPVLDACCDTCLRVARVNPRQARDFARATGELVNTRTVRCGRRSGHASTRPARVDQACLCDRRSARARWAGRNRSLRHRTRRGRATHPETTTRPARSHRETLMSATEPSLRELAARVLPLIDLTSLGEDDTPAHIQAMCARAREHGLPAAVCVYPEHITTARRALAGTGVRIATVVNFPDGGSDPARVERETRRALAAGADEIDLVLPWRALLAGDHDGARAVVAAARTACAAPALLKLILETGELAAPEQIRAAAELGIAAGVDFLKTSTGKVKVNATPAAATILLDVIAAHGGRCGFKAAGGIRSLDDARAYLQLARERLGEAWITPAHLRIGASALYDALLPHLVTPA